MIIFLLYFFGVILLKINKIDSEAAWYGPVMNVSSFELEGSHSLRVPRSTAGIEYVAAISGMSVEKQNQY